MNKTILATLLISLGSFAATQKIAVVFNPKGKFQVNQKPIVDGIKLYFKDKKDVELDFVEPTDDLGGEQEAAKHIADNKIKFVIGHNFSSSSEMFLKSLPKDYEMTYITPLATSMTLLSVNQGVFIPWINNNLQIEALKNFLKSEKKSIKNIVLIINESETYASEMANLFSEKFKSPDVNIKKISFLKDSLDVKKVLDETYAAKPDLVFCPSYSFELLQFYAAIVDKPYSEFQQPIFVSGDTIGKESVVKEKIGENLKKLKTRIYFTNGWAAEIKGNENKSFMERFQKEYHEVPVNGAAAGFDAAKILYESIKKSITKNPNEVNKIIQNEKFSLTIGKGKMSKDRMLNRPVAIYELAPSGFKYIEMK